MVTIRLPLTTRLWRFVVFLLGVEVLLVVLDIALVNPAIGSRLTDLDQEATLPTWFSAAQLLLMSLTALDLWKREPQSRARWGWFGFAALFGYLSLDEVAMVHECAGTELMRHFGWTVWGGHPWLVVFAPLVVLAIGFFGWFAWRILRQSRAAFATALAGMGLWVLVLVIEAACKFVAHTHPAWRSVQMALPLAEEFFEMSGATLLWAAMLTWRPMPPAASLPVVAD